MKQKRTNKKPLTNVGRGLFLRWVALAFCLLAVSAPVQALHVGIFGGFALGSYPAPYVNGGTLNTEDSLNAFHIWSSYIVFNAEGKIVVGSGPFTIHRTNGKLGDEGETIEGYWKARKFRSWKSIGLCGDVPLCLTGGPFGVDFFPNFNAGRLRAKIGLFEKGTDKKLGTAVLTIWCSLPGIPFGVDERDEGRRGIEQYRVKIVSGELKGLDFVVGRSGTVFVDCRLPGLHC